MGLFDFFKKKKPTPEAVEEEKPQQDIAPKPAKPKKKKAPTKPKAEKPAVSEAPKKKAAKKKKPVEVKEKAPEVVVEDEPVVQAAPEVEAPEPESQQPESQQPALQEPEIKEPEVEEPKIQEPVPEVSQESPKEKREEEKPAKKSWLGRLKEGLGKSASKITSGLAEAIGKPKLDAADLDEIEDALIMADLGVAAASRLTEGLKKRSFPDGVTKDSLAEALAEEVAEILTPVAKPLELNPAHKPHVILMVGVNGSGKTTTAGKLAEQWQSEGKKVMMAAADTFRAAAVEQLKIWGERTGTTVISGEQGSDAAAVAYQAYEKAIAEQADVLIIDTAGRLQAKAELMDELAKICRVVAKKDEAAPHDRVIVLDGTVGQNASSQVSAFKETADLTGMIVTKLDGSARGGVVVALAESFGLPIHAVGVGESKDDLRAFDARDFGRALAGLGGDE